jgi:hypothetical protein
MDRGQSPVHSRQGGRYCSSARDRFHHRHYKTKWTAYSIPIFATTCFFGYRTRHPCRTIQSGAPFQVGVESIRAETAQVDNFGRRARPRTVGGLANHGTPLRRLHKQQQQQRFLDDIARIL